LQFAQIDLTVIINKRRHRIWKSTGPPNRFSIRELRALAYDLHAWRSTLWGLRAADNCDVAGYLIQVDALIQWVTAEQARVLIDRVARTSDRA